MRVSSEKIGELYKN